MKTPVTFVQMAIVVALLAAISQRSTAQVYQHEKIVYLDEGGQPTKDKKAVQLHQIIQLDDTLWEFNYYKMNGPRIKSFRTNDASGIVLNGRYISYSASGWADTIGDYVKGRRNGYWSIFSPVGRLMQVRFYKDDGLIWSKDSTKEKLNPDSANFTEAEFAGGKMAWLRFLNHTLRYPDEAVNKNIMGEVIFSFFVDSTGHIPENSVYIDRSIAYSLDRETIRVILASPPWTPASFNGRPANSYQRQPLVFRLESQ